MPSAPSRFEVEHLHRLMIQASAEAARLEGRLGEAQTADGLWPLLRHWHEAAAALDQAVARARAPLEQEGTPKDQIDRIRRRLSFLEQKSKLSAKGRGCARSATAPAPGTSGCGRLGWLGSATGRRRSDSTFRLRAPSSTR